MDRQSDLSPWSVTNAKHIICNRFEPGPQSLFTCRQAQHISDVYRRQQLGINRRGYLGASALIFWLPAR